MIITSERLAAVDASIDKLIKQGKALFDDITETTEDRARLLQEHEQATRDLKTTAREIERLQARVDELEAMLDSVRATVEMARPNGSPPRGLLPRDNPPTDRDHALSAPLRFPSADNPPPPGRDHIIR